MAASGRSAQAVEERPDVLKGWLASLSEFRAKAVLVLGPDPDLAKAANDSRSVVAVYPREYRGAASKLARSDAFGTAWRKDGGSLVAWQNFSDSADGRDDEWAADWVSAGALSMVRAEIPMPFQQGFECFVFCLRQLANKAEAARVAWSVLDVWPGIKKEVLSRSLDISVRERQVLEVIALGRTTKEAAGSVGCTERTVNFHLANVMAKLHADNRAEAIQRACVLGIL